jgi:hypothetical protein
MFGSEYSLATLYIEPVPSWQVKQSVLCGTDFRIVSFEPL